MLCSSVILAVTAPRGTSDHEHKLLVVQCGAGFWAFTATVTKFRDHAWDYDNPADYELELVKHWKDYDAENKLINVRVYPHPWSEWDRKNHEWVFRKDREDFDPRALDERNSIGLNTFTTSIQDKNAPHGWREIKYTIPLLKGIGIGDLVNPLDVFCAIEEHFSREKTAAERTEPIGATNNDKIVMHGFDTKTSFRGR